MNNNVICFVVFCLSIIQTHAQSIEIDKHIGSENAQQIATCLNLSMDSVQQSYITKVGNKLTNQLDEKLFDYTFHIVQQQEPNAFALPGGYIYITTGLLYLIKQEDELACILGHEIIHSNNRHSVEQIKKSILPKLAEVPGQIVGMFSQNIGALLNAPLQTSNALLFASYGRKFENEADEEGVELAAKAGYDPEAMVKILDRMTNAVQEVGKFKEQKSYFSHHPYTPDRLKTIEKALTKINITPTQTTKGDFYTAIDSLSYGLPPEAGTTIKNKFLHRDLNFSFDFPEDWKVENCPTVVTAYNTERNASMALSLESDSLSAKEAAMALMKQMPNQYKQLITEAQPFQIDSKECFVIEQQKVTQQGKAFSSIYFIPLNNQLFRIISHTPIEHKFQIEEALSTLNTLTSEEKQQIKNKRFRIVTAEKGESIAELSARVSNTLEPELTCIINSVIPEDSFAGGEQVKVVIEY